MFIFSFILIFIIDKRTKYLVSTYIETETERLANDLVSKIIHQKLSKYDYKLLNIKYSSDKENINYDIQEINKLTNSITKDLQKELNNLDAGLVHDNYLFNDSRTKRFKHIENGIICDLSIGSIRNSLLFANVGPTIPIKLVFLSQINTDVNVKTKEYGINNIMVSMYLRVTLSEQITMPISSKRKKIVIEEPLMINIIKGEIPYLYDKRIGE